MEVYVLNKDGSPLMPCSPKVARLLLQQGKAKCKRVTPFTIKLKYQINDPVVQEVVAGLDTGSKTVGAAAIANGKVLYQAEVQLRNDVSKKMTQRASFRRTRRGKKTRYRPARWLNRANSRRDGRLAPSLLSKLNSHLREIRFIESILPVSKWKLELASFDIHKISNPDVEDYQSGKMKGYYNTKAYVLHRDGYKCCSGQKVKHSEKLHVHHIIFRSNHGSNAPSNLITLCEDCHDNLHKGLFELKGVKSRTKHATEIGIIKSRLAKSVLIFEETFGYETKFKREQVLKLPKSHANDAIAVCCGEGELVKPDINVYYKRHVSGGDYKQTFGARSEKRLPTGKLFGFRKFDKVKTPLGIGFINGKRSSGNFAISDVFNKVLTTSISYKKLQRISARTANLIQGAA